MIHPALRILSFFLWTVLVSRLPAAGQLLTAGLLIALLIFMPALRPAPALALLSRARWLFAALAVAYLGFTPGDPLLGFVDLPSRQGLIAGSARVAALATVVLSVSVLVQTTPRDQLVAGLDGLLRPFFGSIPGLSRLAPRIVLVLEYLPAISLQRPGTGSTGSYPDRLVEALASAYRDALARAEGQAPMSLAIKRAPSPRGWDFLPPLGLSLALYWV